MKMIGVVLAGGLSSRMLEDKSKLIWNEKSLLEHTEQLLKDAGCFEVIVSHNNSKNSDQGTNTSHIQDRYPKAGPLAGIDACLAHIIEHFTGVKAMLIMPVDMPLMSQSLIANLVQNSEQENATYYPLGRFPLVLPVTAKLSEVLSDILEKHQSGKGASIKHLLSHFNNQILPIDKDKQSVFFNCNTPQQWRSLLSK